MDAPDEPRVEFDGARTASIRRAEDDATCEIHEASPRELFLATGEPLPLHRLTSISVPLDETSDPVSLMGRVTRRRSPEEVAQSSDAPGMVVELSMADRDALRRWREFVESRAQTEGHPPTSRLTVSVETSDVLESLLELESDSVDLLVRGAPRYEPGTDVVCNVVRPEGDAVFQLRGGVLETIDDPPRKRGTEIRLEPVDASRLDHLEAFVFGDTA